ncbi:hypothetical protein [Jeotgalibacillus marinus]|uniref:Uncharacterized protein n=1 Tax=Jeotgalibacillus marinus TaxID=86667 RepID=A0ABV3Q693_9BACL
MQLGKVQFLTKHRFHVLSLIGLVWARDGRRDKLKDVSAETLTIRTDPEGTSNRFSHGSNTI